MQQRIRANNSRRRFPRPPPSQCRRIDISHNQVSVSNRR
ncbi:hypothetical protein LINPERHAP2_LOCUS6355 [Linum perenne]